MGDPALVRGGRLDQLEEIIARGHLRPTRLRESRSHGRSPRPYRPRLFRLESTRSGAPAGLRPECLQTNTFRSRLRVSTLSPLKRRRTSARIVERGPALGSSSPQLFRRSLTDLADEKVSFFDAAILIFSPFAGLRPSRSGVALTLNFPNPGSDTSAPLAAAPTMSRAYPVNAHTHYIQIPGALSYPFDAQDGRT
jgi:hypothetical protein